jgi:hypothetical protein
MIFFLITLAAKIGMQRNPSNTVTTQAPRAPSDGRWEKGCASRGGVFQQLEDGDEEGKGNGGFSYASCV